MHMVPPALVALEADIGELVSILCVCVCVFQVCACARARANQRHTTRTKSNANKSKSSCSFVIGGAVRSPCVIDSRVE